MVVGICSSTGGRGEGKNGTLSSSCKCTAVLASVFIVLSVLFAIGTMTEINQLRIALQESATARNITEGQCISLKVDCLCC